MDEQMQDTSWVKGFLHNVFSGKSEDAEKYMAEKMQYINKPFYKYCYVWLFDITERTHRST